MPPGADLLANLNCNQERVRIYLETAARLQELRYAGVPVKMTKDPLSVRFNCC